MKISGEKLNLNELNNLVGIIGSREASKEELHAAYTIAYNYAKRGEVVTSGLAKGIDTYAHRGALDAGGKTIAIVNTPINQSIYPKENQALAEEIRKNGMILHPFETKSIETQEKGLNQFQKRLIERDIFLSYICSKIITVKNDSKNITGGTKWAMQYGKNFDKKIYRADNAFNFHENPTVQKCKFPGEIELDMSKVYEELLQILSI